MRTGIPVVRVNPACIVLLLALLGVSLGPVWAQPVTGCGSLSNAYGPFDYRDPEARGRPLYLVESTHFTTDVETLRRGASGPIAGDIDYTLRAFPNHHRALNSVARYALQGGRFLNEQIPSADCYFKRAVAFRPDDEVVRMLYGNYLVKRGDRAEAERQYEEALRLAPTSPEINYNAGLFYVSKGNLARAKELAKVAYDSGYPLPGLKNKIAAAEAGRTKP